MVTQFSTTTLVDKVEEKILEYIKENNLVPGDSMPNELQFSEMMGISRNVVREAMSRLRMLGLIQSRTKRGVVITEPPLLNGFEKVIDPLFLSVTTIKEMMGMRIAIEIGLSEFLFANVEKKTVKELEQIVSRQKSIGSNNLSVEDEMIFHRKIYEIAGNNFILQFNEIMHPIFVFAKQNYESNFKPINDKLKKEGRLISHEDILSFIKKKDKRGYQTAIRTHLEPYWEFCREN